MAATTSSLFEAASAIAAANPNNNLLFCDNNNNKTHHTFSLGEEAGDDGELQVPPLAGTDEKDIDDVLEDLNRDVATVLGNNLNQRRELSPMKSSDADSLFNETHSIASSDHAADEEYDGEETPEGMMPMIKVPISSPGTPPTIGDSLEDDTITSGSGYNQDCKICQKNLQSPKVLSCLHVFCERCLDKLLTAPTTLTAGEDGSGDSKATCPSRAANTLACPVCKQVTVLSGAPGTGAASLHNDYVLTNILDLSAIDLSLLACTSCKGKERAISRCNDCANILCASCDNAHQYMRCFENHKVVRLDELMQCGAAGEQVAIHKPLFCTAHPTENLKYYCLHCAQPVCNDCLMAEHKGGDHNYEVIGEAEAQARIELGRLVEDASTQVGRCEETATNLNSALMELQSQHDTARGLIEESYQSFKAVLERCRDTALKQLDTLHSERELKIMDMMHDVEKATDGFERVAKFTNRILEKCNGPEMLSLKKMIGTQYGGLVVGTPKTETNFSIDYEPQFEQFKQLAQDTFGKFRTESSACSPKERTPPPTLPGMPPILVNHHHSGHRITGNGGGGGGDSSGRDPMMLNMMNMSMAMEKCGGAVAGHTNGYGGFGSGQSQGALTNSVTASSPISLPASMQSSFDGDLSGMGGSTPGLGAHNDGNGGNVAPRPPHTPHIIGGANIHFPPPRLNGTSTGLPPPPLGVGPRGDLTTTTSVLPPTVAISSVGSNQSPSAMGVGGASSAAPGGLTSIAEYNIQQLANLVEQSSGVGSGNGGGPPEMNDVVLPTGSVNSVSPQGQFTLADVLSGDPNALNNLHAWSKMGLNSQMSRGPPSPGVDNLLLSDFSTISANGGDDVMLTNFSSNAGGSQKSSSSSSVAGRSKSTPMQIRCKFGSLGASKGQFNSPHGFCLGVDEEIIVADTNNHRIEVFEKGGAFKFQFGVPGKEEGQLWYPRKVAVMRPTYKFVVCDRGNERSRMQIFNKAGHFMKKIAIRYIDIVAGLAVTNQGHIVAVDSVSPTVFIISEEGDLVHWFDCSDYMREPSDIAISGNDFYVCDFKGHCVAVFSDDGSFKYRIGNEKITCFPNGIDISDAGDILIGDSHGNRFHVACYSREGVLQSEYECPYVKVSRCCGLKITSEGFVVTLAKNNHHVLVLNTLYIQ